MDLLDSILNSMGAPPPASNEDKALRNKIRKQNEMVLQKQKDDLKKFRTYVEDKLNEFGKDDNKKFYEFQPMEREYRSIVYDVAEIAGQMGMSFGCEGMDRHVVIYKKDCTPSEDEITARRNGELWNEETAAKYFNMRKKTDDEQLVDTKESISSPVEPLFNYRDKYTHLIGKDSALAAAKKTESNASYGCVPSKNKKDVRSIEETLEDIKQRKKQKLEVSTQQN